MFAVTVQNLYGWSNVNPIAQNVPKVVNDWVGKEFGWKLDLDEPAVSEAARSVETQTN